jgi:uncharacterized protein
MEKYIDMLSAELKLSKANVKSVLELIEQGNTIPFIARYRKEMTGNMSDIILRDLNDRYEYLKNLEKKRDDILRILEEQGNLSDNLKAELEKATTVTELEDLYRPFKPKRRTRATIAMEKGLQPLAEKLYTGNYPDETLLKVATEYVDVEKGVLEASEAIAGAQDIVAEWVAESAGLRKRVRDFVWAHGLVACEAAEENPTYKMYAAYQEAIKTIPPHRTLAINRGENEKMLKVKLKWLKEDVEALVISQIDNAVGSAYLEAAVLDGLHRLMEPSLEREIRTLLTEVAEEKAIKVFGLNLKQLLLQAPIKGKTVIGYDPAYRTGCKMAVMDESGMLLDYVTIYPTAPHNQTEKAGAILIEWIKKYKVDLIALGNGTASRESEQFIAETLKKSGLEVPYAIVSEAGASVYSASKLAQEEYPDLDVSIRGAVSIGARLVDPMAELVKIEPKAIGVGQYQHDVNQKRLDEVLTGVVEDAVNSVGVDVNTASWPLLSYVAGINKTLAKNIVLFRQENGGFKKRAQLLKVPRFGKAAYEQAAGFLRVPGSDELLDQTGVHPESYKVAEALLGQLKLNKKSLRTEGMTSLEEKEIKALAMELSVGEPTLRDIINELKKPGRDPRESYPQPTLRTDVLTIEDLTVGMVLTGTVRNVTDFGAFVDIGIKNDGLVHISELSQKFIKDPHQAVSVGDIVQVKVIGIDLNRHKTSLSIKQA